MKRKHIVQVVGLIAVAAVAVAGAVGELDIELGIILVMAIVAIAAPEALEDIGWGPFG